MGDAIQRNCGAVWVKKDKNGNEYYSIDFRGEKFLIFKNSRKTEDRHPDYTIHPSAEIKKPTMDIPF